MKNKLLIIGVAIMVSAALYFGIDSLAAQNIKEPVTVPFVDIKKYVGTWYEQALIPFFFERGCSQSAAHYSLNDDGSIKVNNTCIRNGKHTQAIGKAISQDSSNSKLKVMFSQTFNIGAPYWIVRLADDYSHVVISHPKYKYLWILSRQKVMNQQLYNSIYVDLKQDGFPVQQLVRTKQQ